MVLSLPSPDTPLYNHPLPGIEAWLLQHGCAQDQTQPHVWHLARAEWTAELRLDIEELAVIYTPTNPSRTPVKRTFKYSLSRKDLENAIFIGP
ncbi:MAG: DUF3143 domain-containing protein [Cyanobacteria bacterium P01_F01_bin.3]